MFQVQKDDQKLQRHYRFTLQMVPINREYNQNDTNTEYNAMDIYHIILL